MARIYVTLALILLQYQVLAAEEFGPMIIEDTTATPEEQLEAMTRLKSYDFDGFSEVLGHAKSTAMMGGFSGIQQYDIAMFRGIKYATAGRFEMPKILPKQHETVIATKVGPSCPQPSLEFFSDPSAFSEDCLFLDVYVPLRRTIAVSSVTPGSASGGSTTASVEESGSTTTAAPEETTMSSEEMFTYYNNLPIMIQFAGVGFSYVESKQYDGRQLATHGKVIVVVVNYRTSALGFMSSGDGRIPGNLGLYDQRVAIQWVKEHAGLFGGNPDSITLLGFSAGAESIAAQMQNAMNSRDLFQKVILQSGVSKQGTLFYNDKDAERKVQKDIFDKLKEKGECADDGVACFQEMNVTQLIGIAGSLSFERTDNRTFGPIEDEHYFAACEDSSVDLLSQYEIMIGTVETEAAMWVGGLPVNCTLYDVVKHLFKSNSRFHCAPERVAVFLDFEYRSHEDDEPVKALRNGFLKLGSDYRYVVPALMFANRAATNGAKVYMYQFQAHIPTMDDERPEFLAGTATHGDDQTFLFGLHLALPALFPSGTRNVSANYLRMLTNFAHTGDPDDGPTRRPDSLPSWEPYSVQHMGAFIISEEMQMTYRLFARNMAVWTEMITYLMSDDVCQGAKVDKPKPSPPTGTATSCGRKADWEKNYVKWRDEDVPRWREAADRYETLAAKINEMAACGTSPP